MHNNQITSISGLANLTEEEAYKRYGPPFIRSLETFSTYSTLEQIYVIHSLQRYFSIIKSHSKCSLFKVDVLEFQIQSKSASFFCYVSFLPVGYIYNVYIDLVTQSFVIS